MIVLNETVGTPRTTASGMTQEIQKGILYEGGETSQIINSTFTKEHPMYKKYGITKTRTHKIPKTQGGNIFYTIEGDIFNGKTFEFKSDIWNKSATMRTQTENFLKSLKRAQGYKITKFLENLVDVAKCIK